MAQTTKVKPSKPPTEVVEEEKPVEETLTEEQEAIRSYLVDDEPLPLR